MATQAFYRKWRSQTFAELVGQEHVTRTLRNAVRTGRVAHAYVFSGPRGVGKTSAARLLAKAVNCAAPVEGEPCNECESCRAIAEGRALDVIEIDAASNNGVDQIRDLTEKVSFMPSESRYKFYILDEAHMLSGSAANAFLKTLEEPPAHTVFVLATTESHKLPATILSRCQRLEFHRVPLAAMLGRLRRICDAEGIEVEAAALETIARAATGSLRDAEGLLDQLVAYAGSRIGVEQVRAIVGLGGGEAAHQLLQHLAGGDLAGGLRLINRLVEAGTDPRQFGREVVDYLRGVMLLTAGEGLAELLDSTPETRAQMQELARRLTVAQVLQALRIFAQLEAPARGVSLGQLPLEMAFVEATLALGGHAAQPAEAHPAPRRSEARAPQVEPPRVMPARPAVEPVTSQPEQARPVSTEPPASAEAALAAQVAPAGRPAPAAEPAPAVPVARTRRAEPERGAQDGEQPPLTRADVEAKWGQLLDGFRRSAVRALLLDVGRRQVEGGVVVLSCRHEFHRKALSEDRTRSELEAALGKLLGRRCQVRAVLDTGEAVPDDEAPPHPLESAASDPLLKTAVGMGYRLTRIQNKDGEIVYDAEPQDAPAAPGQAGQDAGGAR